MGMLDGEVVAVYAILSASSFPRMPTCEGTHIKLIFLLVEVVASIICWTNSFLLYIFLSDERALRESLIIKMESLSIERACWTAKRIAYVSAVYMLVNVGRR